ARPRRRPSGAARRLLGPCPRSARAHDLDGVRRTRERRAACGRRRRRRRGVRRKDASYPARVRPCPHPRRLLPLQAHPPLPPPRRRGGGGRGGGRGGRPPGPPGARPAARGGRGVGPRTDVPPGWPVPGGVFAPLSRGGEPRGCIGSGGPRGPLPALVARMATA